LVVSAAVPGVTKERLVHDFAEMARSYGTGLDFFERFGRDLVAAVAPQPGERVLDLACGRGACLRPTADAVGPNGFVLGIDLSPAMIELTGDDLRRGEVDNAEVRVGDAEHLELDAESFDVVTCGLAVFLFPATAVALGECRRVLRPGGRFAASTFADGHLEYPWLPELLAQVGLMGPMQPMPGSQALTQVLSATGFERVTTTTSEQRFVFADLDAYLLWMRGHALGRMLNRLDADGLQRFEQECERRLEPQRGPEGYELVKQVDLTVAHRD
jgi:ubiquinone/menaquinone biosynthesis C-methylase UbiE